jgi:hypothetical protein
MVSVSKQFGRKVEGGILQNWVRESNAVEHHVSASSALLFAAQPEAPAFAMAGASGWAVNDQTNGRRAPQGP